MAKTILIAIRSEILNDNKLQEKKKGREKLKASPRENELAGSCFICPYSSFSIFSTPSFKTHYPFQNIAYTTVVESD